MINMVIIVTFVTFCVVVVGNEYRRETIRHVAKAGLAAEGVGQLTGSWLTRYFVSRTYVRVVHRGDMYQVQAYSGLSSEDVGLPQCRDSAIARAQDLRARIDQIANALTVDSHVVWSDKRTRTTYPGP